MGPIGMVNGMLFDAPYCRGNGNIFPIDSVLLVAGSPGSFPEPLGPVMLMIDGGWVIYVCILTIYPATLHHVDHRLPRQD